MEKNLYKEKLMHRSEPSKQNVEPSPRNNKNGDPAKSKPVHAQNFSKEELQKYNLLVVDDEQTLRNALIFDFKRRGFTVFSAENGIEALEILQSTEINIVISDIRMPKCNGVELLERVKAQFGNSAPPFIFVTAYTDISEQDLLQKGARKIIPKPFEREQLMSSIFEIISSRT